MTRRALAPITAMPIALAAMLLLAGCASAGSGEDEPTAAASDAAGTAARGSGFVHELAFVPAGDDISYGDIEAAQAALGIEEGGTLEDIYRPLETELGFITPQSFSWYKLDLAGEVAKVLGLSLVDVERFVETGGRSEAVLAFEAPGDAAERLTEALGEPVDGAWMRGDDGAIDLGLGEAEMYSQRIALIDDQVVITSSERQLQMVLDGTTASTDEQAVAAAQALDERGVLSAAIHPTEEGSLAGYLGAGLTKDADGALVHIVAVTDGDAEALGESMREFYEQGATLQGDPLAELSDELEGTPYSEYFTVENVTVDGDTVVVDARPVGDPAAWSALLFRGELW
ncbi:hypothetical protein [Agromyces italicus]|uniref:hypothetical protein n=1 Tax=Agromyces italicus TaxID=279572 RepID=UPI0003B5FC1B|nr:hypothetical protein [Agromyces italicus]